jgi:hypothetical protein
VSVRYRAARTLFELVLAGAALTAAGLSWVHARRTVRVGPIAEGQPFTTSLVYSPQLLLLTMVLATTAGVLAVVAIARLMRERRGARTP